jgi:cytoskeletal protein CcmA (bactofilin family)
MKITGQAVPTDSPTANSKFTLGSAGAKGGATVIGADTAIKGDIKSRGDIVVSGVVEGEVASDSKIVVAAGGAVTGRLVAVEVVVEGKLTGDVSASKSTSLLNGSELRGDVATQVIMIEPGATFVGRCSMPDAGQPKVASNS